jgi:hypothetical protein
MSESIARVIENDAIPLPKGLAWTQCPSDHLEVECPAGCRSSHNNAGDPGAIKTLGQDHHVAHDFSLSASKPFQNSLPFFLRRAAIEVFRNHSRRPEACDDLLRMRDRTSEHDGGPRTTFRGVLLPLLNDVAYELRAHHNRASLVLVEFSAEQANPAKVRDHCGEEDPRSD